jgi:glutathione S-transferase
VLQVLGRGASINVRKVLWTCAELDVPFEHVPWGEGELRLDDPAFTALNPNAMVPVLRDGALVLWESNTICRYLAAQHGREDLLPADAAARARVEQWMDWQATELNTAWRYAFMALVRRSAAHGDAAAVAASVGAWHHHMAILDGALDRSGGRFVTGDRFTLADIVLGLSVQRWLATPMARPDLPAVARYVATLSERPAFLRYGRNGLP